MRRLGTQLGVAAMSLYRHVPNRDALLAAVVNHMVTTALSSVSACETWSETLTCFGRTYRAMLLAHPRAVPLLATHPVDPEVGVALMSRLHADHEGADTEVQSVGVFVLGHALAQVGTPHPDGRPTPSADGAYYDDWFEAGLRAMVLGFHHASR